MTVTLALLVEALVWFKVRSRFCANILPSSKRILHTQVSSNILFNSGSPPEMRSDLSCELVKYSLL
jgi:hypothetical protein